MFLELANKYNMKVLLRPGPFICAEWDLGGIPARLLAIPGIVLRANNAPYLQEVKVYFQNIAPVIRPYLAINNGPIVLLQI